jgi:hypothetical protein
MVEPASVAPEYCSGKDSGVVNCNLPFAAVASNDVKLKLKVVVELAGAGALASKAK